MSYKVFLSHSSKDKNRIEWIDSNLKNIGIETYLYERDPQPGKLISSKIETAIQNCDAFVVLITQNSIDSRYVGAEIGMAMAKGKLIIALVHVGISKTTHNLGFLTEVESIPIDFSKRKRGEAMNTLLGYLEKNKNLKGKETE